MFLRRFKTSKIFSWIAGLLAFGMSLPSPSAAESLFGPSSLGSASNVSMHPALIRGIKISPQDPFHLDFLVDSGTFSATQSDLQKETEQLIKYFLAGLTIQDQDLWVNLSPEEPDRILPDSLARTDLGRDLLSQDYVLKQLTASLLNPDSETGKMFWEKVYEGLYDNVETQDFASLQNSRSIDALKKIWIVPDFADVVVLPNGAYVESARLKVMVESDDIGQNVGADGVRPLVEGASLAPLQNDTKATIEKTILPAIEKEVNEGEAFAPLRQIYHSLILASWFKNHSAKSILGTSYIGQSKVGGIETSDIEHKQRTYQQYLDAFRRGASDVIREEYDPETQNVIPRHYFTGGIPMGNVAEAAREKLSSADFDVQLNGQGFHASVKAEPAMMVNENQLLTVLMILMPIQSWRASLRKKVLRRDMLARKDRIEFILKDDPEVTALFDRLVDGKTQLNLDDIKTFMMADTIARQETGEFLRHKDDPEYYSQNIPAGADQIEFEVNEQTVLRGLLYKSQNPDVPIVIFSPPFGKPVDGYTDLIEIYRRKADVHVLFLDPRGNGRSSGKKRDLKLGDVDNLKAVIEKLKTTEFPKSKVILHGMSRGGIMSARLAAENKDLVGALIVQFVTSDYRISAGLWLQELLEDRWGEKLRQVFSEKNIGEDFYWQIGQDILTKIYGDHILDPKSYITEVIQNGTPVKVIYEKDDHLLPSDVWTFALTHRHLTSIIPGDHIEGHKSPQGQEVISEAIHRAVLSFSASAQATTFFAYTDPESLVEWDGIIKNDAPKIRPFYATVIPWAKERLIMNLENMRQHKEELLPSLSDQRVRGEFESLLNDPGRFRAFLSTVTWFEAIVEDEHNFCLSRPDAFAIDFLNALSENNLKNNFEIVFDLWLRHLGVGDKVYEQTMRELAIFLRAKDFSSTIIEAAGRFVKARLGLDRQESFYDEWLLQNQKHLKNHDVWKAFVRHIFFAGYEIDSFSRINDDMTGAGAQALPKEAPILSDAHAAHMVDILLRDEYRPQSIDKHVRSIAELAMNTGVPEQWYIYSRYLMAQNEDRGFHFYYVMNIIRHVLVFGPSQHPAENIGLGRMRYLDWEGFKHHWPQLIDYIGRMDQEAVSGIQQEWWTKYRKFYVLAVVMVLHPQIHFREALGENYKHADYLKELLNIAASTGRGRALAGILREAASQSWINVFNGSLGETVQDRPVARSRNYYMMEEIMYLLKSFLSFEEFRWNPQATSFYTAENIFRRTVDELALTSASGTALKDALLNNVAYLESLDKAMMAKRPDKVLHPRQKDPLVVEDHEMIHEMISVMFFGWPNTRAYVANQKALRAEFYQLLLDIKANVVVSPGDFEKRIIEAHKILIAGKNGNRIYIPPTVEKDKDFSAKAWADKYAGVLMGQKGLDAEQAEKGSLRKKFAVDAYFQTLFHQIRIFLETEDTSDAIKIIMDFYASAMQGPKASLDPIPIEYVFERGNNSLWMNLVNLMLKIRGFRGILHGYLDKEVKLATLVSASNLYSDAWRPFRMAFLNQLEEAHEDYPDHLRVIREIRADYAMMIDIAAIMARFRLVVKMKKRGFAQSFQHDPEVEAFLLKTYRAFNTPSIRRLEGSGDMAFVLNGNLPGVFSEVDRVLRDDSINRGAFFIFKAKDYHVFQFLKRHVQGNDVRAFSLHHSRIKSDEWLLIKGGALQRQDIEMSEQRLRDIPLPLSLNDSVLFDWHFYIRPPRPLVMPLPFASEFDPYMWRDILGEPDGISMLLDYLTYKDIAADVFFDALIPSQMFIVTPQSMFGVETEQLQMEKFVADGLNRGNLKAPLRGIDVFLRNTTGKWSDGESAGYFVHKNLVTLKEMSWQTLDPESFRAYIDRMRGNNDLNVLREAKLWKMIIRDAILSRQDNIRALFPEKKDNFDQWEDAFAFLSVKQLAEFIVADSVTSQMKASDKQHSRLKGSPEKGVLKTFKGVNAELGGLWFEAKSHDAPVVILLPPMGGYGSHFRNLVQVYRQKTDAHVLLLDPHGYGYSGGGIRKMGMGDSRDLEKVILEIKRQFKNSAIVVHGISMGAITASQLASENPALVDRLILQSVTPNFRDSFIHFIARHLKKQWETMLSKAYPELDHQVRMGLFFSMARRVYRTIFDEKMKKYHPDPSIYESGTGFHQPLKYLKEMMKRGLVSVTVLGGSEDSLVTSGQRKALQEVFPRAIFVPGDHLTEHTFSKGIDAIADAVALPAAAPAKVNAAMLANPLAAADDLQSIVHWKFKADRRAEIIRAHYLNDKEGKQTTYGIVQEYAESRDILEQVVSKNEMRSLLQDFDNLFLREDPERFFEGLVPFEAVVESRDNYFLGDENHIAVDFFRYIARQGSYRVQYMLVIKLLQRGVSQEKISQIISELDQAFASNDVSRLSFSKMRDQYVEKKLYVSQSSEARKVVDLLRTSLPVLIAQDAEIIWIKYLFRMADKNFIQSTISPDVYEDLPQVIQPVPGLEEATEMMEMLFHQTSVHRLNSFPREVERHLGSTVTDPALWLQYSRYSVQWPEDYGMGLTYLVKIIDHLRVRDGVNGTGGHLLERRGSGLSSGLPDFDGWQMQMQHVLEFFFRMEKTRDAVEQAWWKSYRDVYLKTIVLGLNPALDPDRVHRYYRINNWKYRQVLIENLVDRGYASDLRELWDELLLRNLSFVNDESAEEELLPWILNEAVSLYAYRKQAPEQRLPRSGYDPLRNLSAFAESPSSQIRDELRKDLLFVEEYLREMVLANAAMLGSILSKVFFAKEYARKKSLKGGIDFSSQNMRLKSADVAAADSGQLSSKISQMPFTGLKPVVLSFAPLADPSSFWR